jgi:hypothetical protein
MRPAFTPGCLSRFFSSTLPIHKTFHGRCGQKRQPCGRPPHRSSVNTTDNVTMLATVQ